MSIKRFWRTASWLSYTAGVLFFSAQPAVQAAPPTVASSMLAPSLSPAQQSIANLSLVAPNFYRGAQPDYAGLRALKQAGVQVDVCLDNEERYYRPEAEQAQTLGLQFVHIPLNPLRRPSGQDILRFLEVVARKDDKPVFVHCVHGRDRTGAMVAIYRMTSQQWSPDQAYQEMLERGFRPFFKKLSDAVFDVGAQLGMLGHKPSAGFIATHLSGRQPLSQ